MKVDRCDIDERQIRVDSMIAEFQAARLRHVQRKDFGRHTLAPAPAADEAASAVPEATDAPDPARTEMPDVAIPHLAGLETCAPDAAECDVPGRVR